MYNKILNNVEYEIELKRFIENQYGFHVECLTPSKRGSYGETWNIQIAGKQFFVKIHFLSSIKQCYKYSLSILDFLKKNRFFLLIKHLKLFNEHGSNG